MGARGRKSSGSLTVLPGAVQRPDPPAHLTQDEAAIWRATVASEAPETFKTAVAHTLLAHFCQHVRAAERLSGLIEQFQDAWLGDDAGLARFDALLRLRRAETAAAAAKARALRLTNQSRYGPRAAATAAQRASDRPPPWMLGACDFEPAAA
jgi:hypothetical protein